jgi:hypothetical protein
MAPTNPTAIAAGPDGGFVRTCDADEHSEFRPDRNPANKSSPGRSPAGFPPRSSERRALSRFRGDDPTEAAALFAAYVAANECAFTGEAA